MIDIGLINRRSLFACVATMAVAMLPWLAAAADDDKRAWQAAASGDAIVLMRHALAPGTGDPANFDVDDCSTQRNLSDDGRDQARAIGVALAEKLGTDDVDVYSSAWCRCLETASLLGFGEPVVLPALNSFFQNRSAADGQTAALREWTGRRLAMEGARPAVLVSHQVNVTAATGVYPASGELVIVGEGGEALATAVLATP